LNPQRRSNMTAEQLYELLEKAGIEFDVVEVFEGLRTINVVVEGEE
tara:strand:- start:179 stop:316 length:138 start_codon:yes stop_codon:yes gene_type:complete